MVFMFKQNTNFSKFCSQAGFVLNEQRQLARIEPIVQDDPERAYLNGN